MYESDSCKALDLARRVWAMINGELFVASHWFSDEHRARRVHAGIPDTREFATKLDLGLRMIERCRAEGVRFDAVACDSLYGRDQRFRAALNCAGITYAAQVPGSTLVRSGAVPGGRACESYPKK